MKMHFDDIDKKLLNDIQVAFPIIREPFSVLGTRLGISADEVLRRIDKLYGVEYDGQVKPGQSFLTGSIIAIRAMLEDYTWDNLDG